LSITIYFTDGSFIPISHHVSTQVIATIEGVPFSLSYNGTPGYYSGTLPENDETATKRAPGTPYDVIISATTLNYDPALYSFTFYVLQTATEVQLAGDTTEGMTFAYSESGILTVNIVLDVGDVPFWNGTVQWLISDLGFSRNFTSDFGNGTYSVSLDTTLIGYGIFPITLKFNPWSNMSLYASSSKTIQVAITQIQTSVIPPFGRDFYWGWSGYLEFIYWSESFSTGIDGATVTLTLPGAESVVAIDLNNGSYLIWLDTTLLTASSSFIPLTASFSKANHLRGDAIIQIRVLEVPTELVIEIPDINSDPLNYPGVYIVPLGDQLNITVFYNDTNDQEGFVGGLAGANISLNEIFGPTRTLTSFEIVEIGNGSYYFIFDTTDLWLFESSTGAPSPQLDSYTLSFRISIGNRSTANIDVRVRIIELPTRFTIDESTDSLLYGETGRLVVIFEDLWPGHPPGTLVTGANFTLNTEETQLYLLSVSDPYEDPSRPGYYIIEYTAASPFFGASSGSSDLVITLSFPNVAQWTVNLRVRTNPTQLAIIITEAVTYLVPIFMLITLLVIAYVRVWNVPKRLRQINGLIKAIRKGKIPKPISDVKSRQELITDLFNDTFEETGISRIVEQIPQESIPVEVPELGELLIQLSILTHLNQEELDEFKADIAKMKMSEQAAFVKEVIMQEAIRAARRDGKTVEEIVDEVKAEATKKIAGEKVEEGVVDVEGVVVEPEEPEIESVFLPSKDEVPEVELGVKTEKPAKSEKEEDVSFTSDMLSPFEIDELRKELKEKGVPPSEIDTILEQAKELPRDLIEELIKSLDAERRRK